MKNNFKYTGKVVISLGKKRKSSYNSGTIDLFKLFAASLVGDDVSGSSPDLFKIIYSDGSGNKEKEHKLKIVRKELIDDFCRFSAYLTTPLNVQDNFDTKLELLCGNTILAYTSIEPNILKNITDDRSALIEWEMRVGNNE